MEAYYDEKLKRWIFPGDDPAEVAKPLGPPPTIPSKRDIDETKPGTHTPARNDPLAALMAPPGRTPDRALSKGGDPMKDLMAPPRSHYSEPRIKAGASRIANLNVPGSARKPVATPGSKPPAPHFVIFQPTAKSDKKSNE